ncbi:MAG: hypothetical protein OXC91_02900, partial [Rhodobacteraceae bacterium]|nr:hypothetical protein [Paracoccaceae bacterium]
MTKSWTGEPGDRSGLSSMRTNPGNAAIRDSVPLPVAETGYDQTIARTAVRIIWTFLRADVSPAPVRPRGLPKS